MLTDKIRLAGPETFDPEDYLSSSLAVIFPDDITNQHGDAQTSVIYQSPRFGNIDLQLADPQGDDSRKLFSHFLWNAGLQLAEFIEEDAAWNIEGHKVLELGAGTGLAGMISVLAGAEETVISDYPAPEVLSNIKVNVDKNIPEAIRPRCTVEGHEWGVLTDDFSMAKKGHFTRLLVADCLWMPWQHRNLLTSIRHFLSDEDGSSAWVIAGFHTGRAKMAPFYALADEEGLKIDKIWERNAEGEDRPFVMDRGFEDVTARKRWLVVAVLQKKK